ncbi:MAG TPA: hypothetical protein VFQ77_03990 [Pseudonocardiaceae bacterium]|jgi:hypothetical protein|nr:hypothetical protein [Pseudonocardiaceae bacterium]
MTSQQVGGTAPEVVALCESDEAGSARVVGWAMVTGRVVAYVPDHPLLAGRELLNTYSSLDSVTRRLAYAGIYPVRDWAALLDGSPARRPAGKP